MPESVFVRNSKKFIVALDSFEKLFKRIEDSLAREITLNRIEFDGNKSELDLEMLHLVLDVTNVPVFLVSETGKDGHFIDALEVVADRAVTPTFFQN
jgi:imidazole glycerol phosphate synthase subunit HisF